MNKSFINYDRNGLESNAITIETPSWKMNTYNFNSNANLVNNLKNKTRLITNSSISSYNNTYTMHNVSKLSFSLVNNHNLPLILEL